MTDFKAKMHQIRFRLGQWDSTPDPALWSLQRSPDPLAGFRGRFAAGGRGWAGEGEGKWRKGGMEKWRGSEMEGPKLLLNQSPSEPCYATDWTRMRRLAVNSFQRVVQLQYKSTTRRMHVFRRIPTSAAASQLGSVQRLRRATRTLRRSHGRSASFVQQCSTRHVLSSLSRK